MKQYSRIVFTVCVIAILAAGIITASYALDEPLHVIEYDYIPTDGVSVLVPSIDTAGGIVRSSPDAAVVTTKCDIIYKEDGKLKVRHVDLPADGSGYDASDLEILRVLPVKTVYHRAEEDVDVIVLYKNEYIYSVKDLELANAAKAYNNIFEYVELITGDTVQSKTLLSRVLCLMDDLYLEEDFTVNYPCSVELLDSKLYLEGSFNIEHSYAGVFYVRSDRTEKDNLVAAQDGAPIETTDCRFKITAPKATYIIDEGLNAEQIFDPELQAEQILQNALAHGKSCVPDYPTKNLLLQPGFKTYGVTLDYQIDGAPFDGTIAPYIGTAKTLTITATYKGEQLTKEFEICFVDLESGAFVCDALTDSVSKYCDIHRVGKNTTESFELAAQIIELFDGQIPAGKALTIFLTDDSALPYTDENATSLRGSDATVPLDQIRIEGDLSDLALYVRKGSVNLCNTASLYFVYGDTAEVERPADPSIRFSFDLATPDEIIYYLKNLTPSFITNEAYGILNVKDDKVYAGSGANHLLTTADLGIESITGTFSGENVVTHEQLTHQMILDAYFGSLSEQMTYRLKSKTIMIDANHQVQFNYTVRFKNGEERSFSIPVYRALLGAGGESEMFTSNNPLASYFINDTMNWLAPEELNLPTDYYSLLEITAINDIPLSSIPSESLKALLQFEGSNSIAVTDETWHFTEEDFFGHYTLKVNPNYIPAENTTVTVHCYLYDSETENDTKISEYSYTIIIPGIFKCSRNEYYENWDSTKGITPYTFTDNTFYSLIVEMLDEQYTSYVRISPDSDHTENVVLSSATYFDGNQKIDLDIGPDHVRNDGSGNAGYQPGETYTAMIFNSAGSPTIQNVEGIQVFRRVQAVILDGVKISSTGNVYAFADYKGLTLQYLSMKNCDLTDAAIYRNGVSTLSNLYMTTVNLADNQITRLDGLLMRTIHTLDLSGNHITSIDALENLKDLRWLDLSNNSIKRFETLKKLNALQTVFLTGNLTSDPVYGAKGSINIPVYVWIMKTSGVEIFADTGSNETECGIGRIHGYPLTDAEIEGSVVLNAFASPTVLNDVQLARLIQDIRNTQLNNAGGDYSFIFLKKTGEETVSDILYTDDGSPIGSEDTVCYYKVSIKKGGTPLAQREFRVTKQS